MNQLEPNILEIDELSRELILVLTAEGINPQVAVEIVLNFPIYNLLKTDLESRNLYCEIAKRTITILKEAFVFTNTAKLTFNQFVLYYYRNFIF